MSPRGSNLGLPRDVAGDAIRSGVCAGDINNDGYLDLCIGTWRGRFYLFRNNRNGTFRDITRPSGLGIEDGNHYQPVLADFNNDGWTDIFVAIDGRTERAMDQPGERNIR